MTSKLAVAAVVLIIGCSLAAFISMMSRAAEEQTMLDKVQRAHFEYFRANQNSQTGLILDRSTDTSPASVAAVGFALTAYPVAVDRGWISRDEAAAYTTRVFTTLLTSPQGPQREGMIGYHGFFYHMLDARTATRAIAPQHWDSELSSIDTALLMAGVVYARNYYNGDSPQEQKIRSMATALYDRVEWDWMSEPSGLVKLAWSPEDGFSSYTYRGYNEAMILYLLGLGSSTHPLPDSAWSAYISHEQVTTYYGIGYIRMPISDMFVYQFPHAWVDFRGINDNLNRRVGFDYFENSRRAAQIQYEYALQNPQQFRGYGPMMWGLTASDGPMFGERIIDGRTRAFRQYTERGGPDGFDDGTIAPTAALSSIAFTPDLVLPLIKNWLEQRSELFGPYGFTDAFNPTFDPTLPSGWICPVTIGIDQGPVVLMIENYRSQSIWKTMSKDANLRQGLRRAGFTGGWLDRP